MEALLGANPAQCAAINAAYENEHGKSLQKVIKSEFGSDGAYALCAAFFQSPAELAAQRA